MVWATREAVDLLDIQSELSDGSVHCSSASFVLEKPYSMAQIIFPADAVLIKIVPYEREDLLDSLERKFEGYTLHKLCAGIRDESKVAYLGRWYTPEGGEHRTEMYFFEDDRPARYIFDGGANIPLTKGPSWPVDKPRIIDSELRSYFDELRQIRPKASDSIANCVKCLE